jgi:hypothetical protein
MENNTNSNESNINSTDIALILGGLSSLVVAIIYSLKHIRESSCCGSSCKQVVLDGHGDPVRSTKSIAEIKTDIV